ncbi:MAG: hypothetical protein ACO1SX_24055 [Actinomycetota bacterium]
MARVTALLLAVLAAFTLGACTPPEKKLAGSWKADMALTAAKANINLPGNVAPKQELRIVFEADGKYRKELISDGKSAVMEQGKWEANGATLKFDSEQGGSAETDTMVYTLDDKEKTLRLDNPKTGGRLGSVYFRRE